MRSFLRTLLASLASLLVARAQAQVDWVPIPSASNPSARLGAAVAFDSARHRLVLFGGNVTRRPGGPSDETWEWDGVNWRRMEPAHRPAARSGHALAYDSLRGRVVLFGGLDASGIFADTWEWDGYDWERAASDSDSGPDVRFEHALAFDGTRGQTVLFGGRGRGNRLLADTWAWDGSAWTSLAPETSPVAMAGHAMAFDAARQRVVLFGGNDGVAGSLGETWLWDGTTWRDVTGFGAPSPREHGALAYDDSRGVSVLFGGESRTAAGQVLDSDDDTWEWNGSAWHRAATSDVPGATRRPLLAFDPTCAETLLVAYDDQLLTTLETWALAPELNVRSIRPDHGSEAGGDVLVIEGAGFDNASDLSVTVGGGDAEIVDVSCSRIRVRTPAGVGVADVVVRSSTRRVTLPAGFTYVPPELAARRGDVGSANGTAEDVVLVNGGVGDLERRLMVAAGEPIWVYVKAPQSRKTARFALWVWVGEPDSSTLSPLPFGVGRLVFPLRDARATFNNLGRPRALGAATIPSTPAPSQIFRRAAGVRGDARLAFQGIIEDDAAPNGFGVSTTNAVLLHVLSSDGCVRPGS
ncbi:MAG: IPT/TIG domain-containing protein [Planctomycetes bacterium]|nr:IPT/TIG domain-containing protein [Planctomycetota bacterium]